MDDRTCCNCGLGASSIYSPALPCGCPYCYVCEGRGRHEDHPWSECEGPEGADPAATLASKRAAVVQAARALIGTEAGSLPHGIGINDLKRALAELDREFAEV